ncbi:hypothetical protein A5787_00690 [Mycobacterium sp. 852002-50816_SCH5313054-b]|uniref:hypothetical protein n=1 Tax=Mycobacterium sp. 852002-50816_SCH5313054-b TaxID=1834092 RepID=UPI0007FFB9CD|nr:hypothetical protein [Mycobacterium sp. 852002-50816_SCH5313054-b]OBF49499.1 hypothetical protein A5787_00690 [Mycobacterium sp. 852002-50816_SCH5313054-b]
MPNRKARAAAVCGGAVLVFAFGFGTVGAQAGAGEPLNRATSSSSGVAPTGGGDGAGAIRVQPVGGGACIIGLNCGCIPHRTCPTPHARPGTGGANQHNAPAPQNP